MGKLSDTKLRGLKPRDKNYMLSDGEDFSNGDIVVAMWCGRLYIRGYFENADGVELRPRATGYETIHIQRGDERLHIVGKVIRRYPKSQKEFGFYN